MTPIVNLDEFFPASWSKSWGGRAFQFDAFISHNRGDRCSKRLAEELRSLGANIWHDDNEDLRDRKVQQRAHAALIRSRFVVVCIDVSFRDSPWCRAEYVPAEEVAKRTSAPKVIVAQMDPSTHIPPRLETTPRFECYQQGSVERLCSEIRNGNHIPSDLPSDEKSREALYVNPAALAETSAAVSKDTNGKKDSISMMLRMVANALQDGDHPDPPQYLMATRQAVIEAGDLAALCERDRAFLVSAAKFFCALPTSDNRANGLYMLLYLAENTHNQLLHHDVLHIFLREPDDSLLSIGFPWFDRQWSSLNAQQRSIVELCALRDPTHLKLYYSQSQMLREFSAVTRVKIFNRGLETEILSYEEKMLLLVERADYILELAQPITGALDVDALRKYMRISDLEILFRDLSALLFKAGDTPKSQEPDLAVQVTNLKRLSVIALSTTECRSYLWKNGFWTLC
jgi:hypothetical protein